MAYVPMCYLELLLDMLTAYRDVEAPFASAQVREQICQGGGV